LAGDAYMAVMIERLGDVVEIASDGPQCGSATKGFDEFGCAFI